MALSIKAEEILQLHEISITNSLITAIIITLSIIAFYFFFTKNLKIIPNKFQIFIEWVIESLYNLSSSILGEKAKKVFPVIFTFFILIIISNWSGLLPITGSIGNIHHQESVERLEKQPHSQSENKIYQEFTKEDKTQKPSYTLSVDLKNWSFELTNQEITPFLRSPSADLNFTLAMAIIAFILIQYIAISNSGLMYLAKFFDYRVPIYNGFKILLTPLMFIINFAWKTLELILEFSKILSFTFRLFGNIFAGEVLLAVVTMLTLGIITLPFLGFEIFVGFIQAIVFIFLTMVFIKVNLETAH